MKDIIVQYAGKMIPDRTYLKLIYRIKFHKKLNLKNPKTFNEKLQWLKIYDRKPVYTTMVDKYEAKRYVEKVIGGGYIIPTLKVWDSVDEINFEELPIQFVLKCTHNSGGNIVCKDKNCCSVSDVKKKLERCLNRNYFWQWREWPYKNVKPRIIAEEYMEDKDGELRDYKFFSFNGKVKFFKVDFNRFTHHQANYYDTNGKLLNFGEEICPPDYDKKIILPDSINDMIKLAEKLSAGCPFLRVDFYDVDGKIYFGELTLYPASGFGKFEPEEWDELIGLYLDL